MPRKLCVKCNQKQDVENFLKQPRNNDGLMSYCRGCCNAIKKEPVTCDHCGHESTKGGIAGHKKTQRCINHEERSKNPFSSTGHKYVRCPGCQDVVKEKVAYRHMRTGECPYAEYKNRHLNYEAKLKE